MVPAQNIMVIPATRTIGTQKPDGKEQKKRVAAYCRVSTELEEQESSYEVQVEHYKAYIKNNPEWELADIYADDGISATSTAKRDEFNRMIQDCREGKIDMILTKSISRFARNTVDCLKYTRELKSLNIAVYFEKENINTLDSKGEVLITIMAALAQQESESLSANVRLGLQFRNQQGKIQINHNRFLGYTKDEEGNLVIVPEEAEIVRRIYAEYMDGRSFQKIKRGLEADGIRNGAGNTKWHETNIKQILTNEKYIGDALLQKTVTTDFLTKKRVVNKGIAPQYYVENSHEAIIPREIFMQVQDEMQRRANLETGTGKKRVYSGKYALSNRVYCSHCGDIFRRSQWFIKGERIPVWRCVSRLEKRKADAKCPSRTLYETELQKAVVTAINQMIAQKDELLPGMKLAVENAFVNSNAEEIARIDSQLEALGKEMLQKANARQNIDDLAREIDDLHETKLRLQLEDADRTGVRQRMKELEVFLNEQTYQVTDYDEGLARKLIEKITVYDDRLVFEFRSGIETEVQM